MVSNKHKLGIIAGGGNIPAMLIEKCINENIDFVVVAIEGNADKEFLIMQNSIINGYDLVKPEQVLNILLNRKSLMLF